MVGSRPRLNQIGGMDNKTHGSHALSSDECDEPNGGTMMSGKLSDPEKLRPISDPGGAS